MRGVRSTFITDGIVLIKLGKILFKHPEGTHDDRFWAVALAVYAAEQAEPPPLRPIALAIDSISCPLDRLPQILMRALTCTAFITCDGCWLADIMKP